jgi:WD40 repeat protein
VVRHTVSEESEVCSGLPSGSRSINGWKALALAKARGALSSILARNSGPIRELTHEIVPFGTSIYYLDLTSCQTRVVAACHDCCARMVDLQTNDIIAVYRGHEDSVWKAVLTPNNQRVVTCSRDGTAMLFDVHTARRLVTYNHGVRVRGICFSRDCRQLFTAGDDAVIRIWETNSGEQLGELQGHMGIIEDLCLSPDGEFLLSSCCDSRAKLWHIVSRSCIQTLENPGGAIWSACFGSGGRRAFTVGKDKIGRMWDVESGRPLMAYEGHEDSVSHVAVGPDDQVLFTAGHDGCVRAWSVGTGKCLRILEGHADWVRCVIPIGDGRTILSASDDGTIRRWRVRDGKQRILNAPLRSHSWAVAASPDGRHLAVGSDRDGKCRIKIYDLRTGAVVHTLELPGGAVNSICFTQDGGRMAAGHGQVDGPGGASMWEVPSGRKLVDYVGHASMVLSVWIDEGSRQLVTGSWDRSAMIWDLDSGAGIAEFRGHGERVRRALLTSDGRRLITASADGAAKLWSVQSRRCLRTFLGHEGALTLGLALTPNERGFFTCGEDMTGRLWDTESGKCIRVFNGHTRLVRSLAVTRDGETLITASRDGTLGLWDVETGTRTHVLRGHGDWVNGVSICADGKRVASVSGDGTVKFWDIAGGSLLGSLHLLDEGFLWTTPGEDEEDATGYVHTDRPDLVSVIEFGERGTGRNVLPHSSEGRRRYLLERQDPDRVMRRISGERDQCATADLPEHCLRMPASLPPPAGQDFTPVP